MGSKKRTAYNITHAQDSTKKIIFDIENIKLVFKIL